MEGFLGETKEERITVVDTGGDKAMYKNRGGVNVCMLMNVGLPHNVQTALSITVHIVQYSITYAVVFTHSWTQMLTAFY